MRVREWVLILVGAAAMLALGIFIGAQMRAGWSAARREAQASAHESAGASQASQASEVRREGGAGEAIAAPMRRRVEARAPEPEAGPDGGAAAAVDAQAAALRAAKECATKVGGACGFLDPSAEELKAMARCGTVKSDAPGSLLGADERPTLPAPLLAEAGVGPEEEARIAGRIARLREEVRAEMRVEFARAGVELDEAATLGEMVRAMRMDLAPSVLGPAQRAVARERAGEGGGEGGGAAEQIVRTLTGLGDRLEKELGAELGPARARELRVAQDGWDSKSVATMGCEEG